MSSDPERLLAAGVVVSAFGAVLVVLNFKNWQRRRRVLATPTSRIARVRGPGPVEIKGRIRPSEEGVFPSPLSGQPAVFCRVTVEQYDRAGRGSGWQTVLNEVEARLFLIEDGSGQVARVMPFGATVVLDKRKVASSGTFSDAPQHLEAFLAGRGLKSTNWLGLNKSMRYVEEILAPDDPIYALGLARHVIGQVEAEGYRGGPTSELVLSAESGPGGELILSNRSERDLARRLATGFVAGVALIALGVLIVLGAILLGHRA